MTSSKTPIEYALVRTTVRISAGRVGMPPTSVGTGFFFKVGHGDTGPTKALIITNKHVIADADVIHFVLPRTNSLSDLNDDLQPIDRVDHEFTVSIHPHLFLHPDPDTDLCAIDITAIAGMLLQQHRLRVMFLDVTWLPNDTDKKMMRDVAEVLVVGYPNGIWDDHNNMPIARIGATATHPLGKYKGKRNFLLDIAAFQGSSGSPVFTYESPLFRDADGNYQSGTKVNLIGLIWAVIERTVQGEIRFVEVPSSLQPVPVVQASLNLAVVVHGDAIRELDDIIRATLPTHA